VVPCPFTDETAKYPTLQSISACVFSIFDGLDAKRVAAPPRGTPNVTSFRIEARAAKDGQQRLKAASGWCGLGARPCS